MSPYLECAQAVDLHIDRVSDLEQPFVSCSADEYLGLFPIAWRHSLWQARKLLRIANA